MGIFGKKKDSKFIAWLKASQHLAEIDAGGSDYAHRLSGRISGERLWLDLSEEEDHAFAILGVDSPVPPKGLDLSRPDPSKIRDALAVEAEKGPLPETWALDSDQSTLFPYLATPKALHRLLSALSQRVRSLSLDGKGLSASLHLPKAGPERISDDLAALAELLKFSREPKEDEEPKPEEPKPEPKVNAVYGPKAAAAKAEEAAKAAEAASPVAASPQADEPLQLELGAAPAAAPAPAEPAPVQAAAPAPAPVKVDEKPAIPKTEYLGDL